MLSRIFAFFLVLVVVYVLVVFLAPHTADMYGNREINEKIRSLRTYTEKYSSGNIEAQSLIDQARDIARPYVEDTQNTVQVMKNTVETKVQQAKQAVDSVKNAYDAVETAKSDLQKLSTFSSGGTKVQK